MKCPNGIKQVTWEIIEFVDYKNLMPKLYLMDTIFLKKESTSVNTWLAYQFHQFLY